MRSPDSLPAALPAMWRALVRGYRAEPVLLLVSFGLSLLAALPDALFVIWLKWVADGIQNGNRRLVFAAAFCLAGSAVATWFLRVVSDRVQRHFRDRVTIALESHVAWLQASVATVAHQERPDYLDRLAVLRDQVFVLDHLYMSLFSTCGWLLRLGVAVGLLVSIHPALAFLLLCATPAVLVAIWRPRVERAAEEGAASANRLARHLFNLATTASPGKEVRVTRMGERLARERRAAWERWYAPVSCARWGTGRWQTLAWAVFAAGYVGAVVFVSSVLHGTPGQVLMVLAVGARLSAYIGATAGEIGFLQGIWLDGSVRLAWLEDYAASFAERTDAPVPDRLQRGIRLEHVSFAYPGTDKRALEDVNLELPAGSVVAIVGENGAGKSTLVKLLCGMYTPDQGRIWIDGVDLARMPSPAWRARIAGAFQDFFRFEFRAAQTVGLGDLPRLDDRDAVSQAVARAGAQDVIAKFAHGLETQLGATWPGGADLSFGQWQKLALARGFMRDRPLLLVLDEPTAALDAETEHALFERYAAAARGGQTGAGSIPTAEGRITILVSHRFSTVRMADLIVVMDGARVVEVGSHDQLLVRRGAYAELYELQASAYR